MPARGPGTFGWDPVFEYEGETYAEMSKERKVSQLASFRSIQLWSRVEEADLPGLGYGTSLEQSLAVPGAERRFADARTTVELDIAQRQSFREAETMAGW